MDSQNQSRRSFLKIAASLAGLAATTTLFSKSALAEKRRGGAPAGGDLSLSLVKEGQGMAASVNYFEKHANVKDAKLKTERQGVKWEQQFCNNCMLYTKVGDKGGEVGKCTLFQGQLVRGEGWCASWSKKA
ncbi:MAG: high-potential iron-sulfur protein [Proteobacteria bacterium]|nr:high-potential iron-sulfur protein [Pseudomonadota bacterium]